MAVMDDVLIESLVRVNAGKLGREPKLRNAISSGWIVEN